jgi:hypothetical protein
MKKDKKSNFNLDFGTFLLITGALANVPLWIGAFTSAESQSPVTSWINAIALPVLGSLAALAMGFTTAFGLVYVISHLGKMQPTIERKVRGKDEYKIHANIRFYGAAGAVGLLLAISLVLLSPVALMIVSGKATLYGVLGSQWAGVWAFGRVAAADLALGAIALVHGVQFGATAGATAGTQRKKVSETLQVVAKEKRKRITNNELLAYLAEHKGETNEQVAQYFGVTRQAIGQRVKTIYAVKENSNESKK